MMSCLNSMIKKKSHTKNYFKINGNWKFKMNELLRLFKIISMQSWQHKASNKLAKKDHQPLWDSMPKGFTLIKSKRKLMDILKTWSVSIIFVSIKKLWKRQYFVMFNPHRTMNLHIPFKCFHWLESWFLLRRN